MAAVRRVRVATDLFEAAVREGAVNLRSADQQIDHWARIGLRVTRLDTVARHRIERAMAGELAWSELSPAERRVADAELDVAIDEAAARVQLGKVAAEADGVAVALDADGVLREHHPGGTSQVL